MAGAVCISEHTFKLIHRNNFVAETFEFKDHRPCEIGTIGKTIKSYKVDQIFNEEGESSEEFSEGDGDGDEDDGQDRSMRSGSMSSFNEENFSNSQSEERDDKEGSAD